MTVPVAYRIVVVYVLMSAPTDDKEHELEFMVHQDVHYGLFDPFVRPRSVEMLNDIAESSARQYCSSIKALLLTWSWADSATHESVAKGAAQ